MSNRSDAFGMAREGSDALTQSVDNFIERGKYLVSKALLTDLISNHFNGVQFGVIGNRGNRRMLSDPFNVSEWRQAALSIGDTAS